MGPWVSLRLFLDYWLVTSSPGDPRALTHPQVKPGFGTGANLPLGRAGSWDLVARPRDLRVGVRLLMGGAGY